MKRGIQMTRLTRHPSAVMQGMHEDPAGGATYQPLHPMPASPPSPSSIGIPQDPQLPSMVLCMCVFCSHLFASQTTSSGHLPVYTCVRMSSYMHMSVCSCLHMVCMCVLKSLTCDTLVTYLWRGQLIGRRYPVLL